MFFKYAMLILWFYGMWELDILCEKYEVGNGIGLF